MEKLQEKLNYLKGYGGRPLRLMEVCGTHTAGIFRSGLRSVISPRIRLISGPGCPVCVTPTAYIDKCVEYALTAGFALVSFGDMLKVPGSNAASLERAKGFGARVELVYSPFDVIAMAQREPGTVFVIAAVGFETTAPAYALLMDELAARGVENVRLLTALKSALPAIDWCIRTESSEGALPPSVSSDLSDPARYAIDGFLCPGHVSVITGSGVYWPLAEKYGKPFVVAGFEEAHLVDAIYELVRLAAGGDSPAPCMPPASSGAALVSNCYSEAVSAEGNAKAREIVDNYFERGSAVWRGLGTIADSGLYLRERYASFDAGSRALTEDASLPKGCRCADVITGRIDPKDCPMFGGACTPENAQGPCMVSSEGACGIWHAAEGR
ncbi:MAG: hydrogenase formation protein HypD [Clostridiales Family XIII bacterium]|jgi:hydrogenase expression/formation protein HypD|nr:hydrogenase formation protein HypD [Clostridiales Family XIII bacterium]